MVPVKPRSFCILARVQETRRPFQDSQTFGKWGSRELTIPERYWEMELGLIWWHMNTT